MEIKNQKFVDLETEDGRFVESFLGRDRQNPILKQYLQHIGRPGRNCEPWHAIGQKLHIASACAWAIVDKDIEVRGPLGPIPPEKGRNVLLRDCAEWIREATPFLWSKEMEQVADAAPLPKHTISPNALPAPAMFWTFETASVAKEGDHYIEANFTAIRHDGEGIMLFFDQFEVTQRGEPVKQWNFGAFTIHYGQTWPYDFQKAPGDWPDGVGRFLKRCAFLSSPYINKDKVRLAHHHRRQLERSGEPPEKVEETVSVVKLRREVKEAVKRSGQPASAVEWQHQWWVSGHYRAQWYPHEEAHKVIWIAPYLKGPEDKPILEKMYAVVR